MMRFTSRQELIARVLLAVNLCLLAAALIAVHEIQIADTNAYLGYRHIDFDIGSLAVLSSALFALIVLMPTSIDRPSKFFAFFYGLFVLLPYAAFYTIKDVVEPDYGLLSLFILLLPLAVIRTGAALAPGLRMPAAFSYPALEKVMILVCISGVVYAFVHAPSSAGFDLDTSYDRRIEGREIFAGGTPPAYLNAAIVNGIAPFLAFLSGWSRRKWVFAVAAVSGIAFYYLLGLKAPIFYIALAYLIGHAVSLGKLRLFGRTIFILLWLSLAMFLAERLVFGFSLTGDYFLRRTFSVPPFVLSNYFEFIFRDPFSAWSWSAGIDAPEGIAYFIGERYMGIKGANANTNAFVYQLANGGIVPFVATILLVVVVFSYLDATFRATGNPGLLFLGFTYGILLTEQAATTALVSSGIGALILLVSLAKVAHVRWHEHVTLAAATE